MAEIMCSIKAFDSEGNRLWFAYPDNENQADSITSKIFEIMRETVFNEGDDGEEWSVTITRKIVEE